MACGVSGDRGSDRGPKNDPPKVSRKLGDGSPGSLLLLRCLVLGVLSWREFAALDIAFVQFYMVLLLLGQVVQRKNRGDGADRHTGAAIDALHGINV